MDGISSYMGMQAQMLQRSLSMAVLDMSMNQGATLVSEMLDKMPEMAQSVPVAEGEVGFNLDVYA
ncbi:MAG: putative motility protein [Aminipila sp.]